MRSIYTTGYRVIGLVLLLACVFGGFTKVRAEDWPVAAAHALRQQLQARHADDAYRCGDQGMDLNEAMIRFYQVRAFRPAWVDRYGLRPEGAMALASVQQAGDQGLRDTDYRNRWLENLLGGIVTRPVIIGAAFEGQQVQFDLAVTAMVLRFAWDRTVGRADPVLMNFGPAAEKPSAAILAVALAEALDRGHLENFLAELGPRHPAYRALQQSMVRYRRIARRGGWPAIDAGATIQPGDCGPRVMQLRNRLAVTGDLPVGSAATGLCFGKELEAAVARFQKRHGLHADGVAGVRTLAALNVPIEWRIRQIQLSLERWRWMPADMGSRYLLANIPGFQLQLVEAGRVVKTMRTVVGRRDRPTPVLASEITYLELNPYWYVPTTIAGEDLLPKIQANPNFLIRQNFRVFDGWAVDALEINPLAVDWSTVSRSHFPYRLRQEPAGTNALGRVKFMFPNELSVYLHDTPAKGLFQKASRPFSSGCVRVEKPLELVSLLLDRQGWDQERLGQAVASNQRQVVRLDTPIPVYLAYFTAWVAADGTLHFGEDIYGHDQTLHADLFRSTAARAACRPADPPLTYAGDFGRSRQHL
jgi:murein L,D-transpeptidase YcbB/YkuD